MTKVPGASASFNDPQADMEMISVTPERLRASMLARKLSSLGPMRWPRPWRGRKTMGWPSSSPKSSSSEGSPKGEETLRHSLFSRPSR